MEDRDPILITVKDGRFEAHSLKFEFTPRDLYLIGVLQGLGGVNETVPEGRHLFNVTEIDGQIVATLFPTT